MLGSPVPGLSVLRRTHVSKNPESPQGRGQLLTPPYPRDRHRGSLGSSEAVSFREAPAESSLSLAARKERTPTRDSLQKGRRARPDGQRLSLALAQKKTGEGESGFE